MLWHRTQCSFGACWKKYYIENAIFQDVEKSPKVYEPITNPLNVTIVNFSTIGQNNTIVSVSNTEKLDSIEYFYDGKKAVHTLKLAKVNYTDKGVPFADISNINTWSGDAPRQRNNLVLTANTTNISVVGKNLFETVKTDYHYEDFKYEPEKALLNPALIGFVSFLGLVILS